MKLEAGPITIPMRQQGTKLGFISRVSTRQELQNCDHINMTSIKQWNPNEVELNETNTIFTYPYVTRIEDGSYGYLDPSLHESMIH